MQLLSIDRKSTNPNIAQHISIRYCVGQKHYVEQLPTCHASKNFREYIMMLQVS